WHRPLRRRIQTAEGNESRDYEAEHQQTDGDALQPSARCADDAKAQNGVEAATDNQQADEARRIDQCRRVRPRQAEQAEQIVANAQDRLAVECRNHARLREAMDINEAEGDADDADKGKPSPSQAAAPGSPA